MAEKVETPTVVTETTPIAPTAASASAGASAGAGAQPEVTSAAPLPTATTAAAGAAAPNSVTQANVADEDSDPDFDDLDDVLDQFSANAPAHASTIQSANVTSTPNPAASGPGRPKDGALSLTDGPIPGGPKPGESEEEFITRLSTEMSSIFANLPNDADLAKESPADLEKMGKELEEFTKQMEQQGVNPEDLLKAILGQEEGSNIADAAIAERQRRESDKPNEQSSASSGNAQTSSFEETIRKTMSRLNESDTQAKTASQKDASSSEADMLAEMLKSLEAGGAGGEEGIQKMFLDMMHQLTQKDLLYEPMKELHDQYPDWLDKHKPPKTKQEDYDRYLRQSEIVKKITAKFEEPGFSDDKDECRQYIWDRMQEMQAEGAPPEELVKNPFPGTDMSGGIPGLGGGGIPGDEEGCPTQ